MPSKEFDVRKTLLYLLDQLLPGLVDLVQPRPEQAGIMRETRIRMRSRDDFSDSGRRHTLHGFEGFLEGPCPVVDRGSEVTMKVPHTGSSP